MKTTDEIKKIMTTIPPQFQKRWCGGELGPCACMGCVQVCNRVIMFEKIKGRRFIGDPEHIDESAIPADIYERYKINKDEWELWMKLSDKIEL